MSSRARGATILLPALVYGEMAALGCNGDLLAVLAAEVELLFGAVAVLLLEPDDSFWRRARPVFAGFAALLLWTALPALVPDAPWLSGRVAPDLLPPALLRMAGGGAVMLAGGCIGYRHGLFRVAVDWLILFGLAHIALGLTLRQLDPGVIWGWGRTMNTERFSGTMLNANASGCASAVLAILATGRLLSLSRVLADAKDRMVRVMQLVCPLAILAGIGTSAISGSRTALLLAMGFCLWLAAADGGFRRVLRTAMGRAALMMGGVAALAILLAVGSTTLDRFGHVAEDASGRLRMWAHYARLAADAPLGGYGPLAFSEVNARSIAGPFQARYLAHVNAAHNKLLETVIELGWPGLLLFLGLIMTMLIKIAQYWRWRDDDAVLRAGLWALAAIGGCSMVDIALDVPAVTALATLLLSMLWGRALRLARKPQPAAVTSASRA